jgi:hypothetical protein
MFHTACASCVYVLLVAVSSWQMSHYDPDLQRIACRLFDDTAVTKDNVRVYPQPQNLTVSATQNLLQAALPTGCQRAHDPTANATRMFPATSLLPDVHYRFVSRLTKLFKLRCWAQAACINNQRSPHACILQLQKRKDLPVDNAIDDQCCSWHVPAVECWCLPATKVLTMLYMYNAADLHCIVNKLLVISLRNNK